MASNSSSPPRQLTYRSPVLPFPDDGSSYCPTHIPGVYMRIPKMIGLTSLTWLPSNNDTKDDDKVKIGPLAEDWSNAVDAAKYGVNSKYSANTVDTKAWVGVRVPGVFVKRDEVVGAVVLSWVDRRVEPILHVSQME